VLFRVFLIALALVPAAAVIARSEPRKTSEHATVRRAASTKSRVVARLPVNTAVTVVKETGEWIEVRARLGRRQITGFVAKSAITPATVAAPEPEAVEPVLAPPASTEPRTTIEAVVVRKKPGEKEAVAGNLPAGTEVRIEGELGRWMMVRAGSVAGFVMRTQLTGPTPATDTTAFAPQPAPAPTVTTRKWGKRDPDQPIGDQLAVFASADSVLRSDAKPEASEIARVAAGARLVVLDAAEVAGFIRVRDDEGREGYVARAQVGNGAIASALSAPTLQAPIVRREGTQPERQATPPLQQARSLALRLDAGIGYRVLGMDFTSNGNRFANYLASASAAAAEADLDVMLHARRLVIGVDAQLGASRSSPGIDYFGPTAPPGRVTFSTLSLDAGVRVGVRARRVFVVAARAGAHYDAFMTSSLENAPMLPRESLLGATLGARADIVPPASRVSATVHFDALAFGRRRQTSGLEDGADHTARAVWAGVTARFAFGRRFALLGAYDFGRATTEWSGMSTRDPTVTSARRVDSTQLVQIGLSIGL
jgi:uncharacterized protein YgiM (DUF1202 family)